MIDKTNGAAVLAGTAAQNQTSDHLLDYQKPLISASGKSEPWIEPTEDTDIQRLWRAVDSTIPRSNADVGKIGNEPIFRLCRKLSGLFDKGISADNLLDQCGTFFEHWYEKAKPIFDSVKNGIESYDDFVIQFRYIWDNKKVKHPDREYIPMALSNAIKWYSTPRQEMLWCKDSKILLLAAVCFELQALHGEGYFWISQYSAEKVCTKQARQCGFILADFCRRGILMKIKSGDRYLGGNASEYRYIGGHGLDGIFPGGSPPPTDIPEFTGITDVTKSPQGYYNDPPLDIADITPDITYTTPNITGAT